jgi:Mrp family chromosome partitioning ATPase
MTAPATRLNGRDSPVADIARPGADPKMGICHNADLADAARRLLHRLPWRGNAPAPPLRLVGLTSCAGGEGVSTFAAHLAVEAARTNRGPILLVDAHPARPAAHNLLGVQAGPGWVDALRESVPMTDALQPCTVPQLYVLASGSRRDEASASDDLTGLPELLETLKEEFALTVVDLPPASEVDAPAYLAAALDGVVLVAEAGRTLLEDVRRQKDRWESQTRLLGVVLNKNRQSTPRWLDRLF